MSRAGIAWAGLAVAAVAVAAFAVRSSTVENRPASTSRMASSDPRAATAPISPPAVAPRPSGAADGARPTRRPPIPRDQRAPAVYSPDPHDDRPLVGLGYRSTTDAERTRLAVPDRFGRGVIITSIHPDAPAVLSGLAIDDVILRADRTDVHGEADLEAATGERLQTVLTVARGGRLFEVVLHRPYRPAPTAEEGARPQ